MYGYLNEYSLLFCCLFGMFLAPRERGPGDPLVISEVRRGSIAHRSGTLQPGDKLLAIDQFRMESSTIEEAARILQNCQGVVQLRIRKDEHFSGEWSHLAVVFFA